MANKNSKVTRLPNFLSIKEVAENSRNSERSVHRWIDAGDLVVHRLGSRVLISEDDYICFLAERRE
jgi:excisionase family DNA binding protein